MGNNTVNFNLHFLDQFSLSTFVDCKIGKSLVLYKYSFAAYIVT